MKPAAKKAVEAFAKVTVGFKAESFDDEEGIIIGKLSVAGNFDRENERVLLPALKAATYELARNIGTPNVAVDENHDEDAMKCDVLQTWIGHPMPDENATYVAVRPHDPAVFEDAKKGAFVGFSWSGPYVLEEV